MTQSLCMFLVMCNEAFHYTHEQTLDSSMAIMIGMLKEHGFVINERNKAYDKASDKDEDDGEYVTIIDFDTGEEKRIKKVQDI